MSRVIAKRTGKDGSITDYKLDDGRVLNRQEIVNTSIRGEVEGVSAFTTRDGGDAVRSDRGQWDYSLSELPEF